MSENRYYVDEITGSGEVIIIDNPHPAASDGICIGRYRLTDGQYILTKKSLSVMKGYTHVDGQLAIAPEVIPMADVDH